MEVIWQHMRNCVELSNEQNSMWSFKNVESGLNFYFFFIKNNRNKERNRKIKQTKKRNYEFCIQQFFQYSKQEQKI